MRPFLLCAVLAAPAAAFNTLEYSSVGAALVPPDAADVTAAWTVGPHGAKLRVEYGTSAAYGLATDWLQKSGDYENTATFRLTNLAPGAVYHYRVHAEEPLPAQMQPGPVYSPDAQFILPTPSNFGITLTGSKWQAPKPYTAEVSAAWKFPSGGARIRLDYGRYTTYGNSTPWMTRNTGLWSEEVFSLTGLTPSATYHFRLYAEPLGGAGGVAHVESADATFFTGPGAPDACQAQCAYADAECRSTCVLVAAKRAAQLKACVDRCRADDPQCPALCAGDTDYVSKAPVYVEHASTLRCPAGWQVHSFGANMTASCFPQASDDCRGKETYTVAADLTCMRENTKVSGGYDYKHYDETLCVTKRGWPQKVSEKGWWATQVESFECGGRDPAVDCAVRCAD